MKRLLPILLLVFSVGVGAQIIEYNNGIYTGDVVDGVPHGDGAFTYYIGSDYVGKFKRGKRNGQGIFTFYGGDAVVGEWREGKRWHVVKYSRDGKVLGNYIGGKWCGSCRSLIRTDLHESAHVPMQETIESADGIYVGETLNYLLHGHGRYTYANGEKYVGQWKDDKKHGHGIYTYVNGTWYVGQWKDDKKHGHGVYTYGEGERYVGQWKDDKKHGRGTNTYADGRVYVGEWKDGYKWDGGTYTGELVNGVPHGQGTFVSHGGLIEYVGEFQNGRQHGQGTKTYADGRKYVGEWNSGKRHGQGTIIDVDGRKYVGEWKDGKEHGQGTYTFADGAKYVGELQDGLFNGQGTRTLVDGTKYIGTWKDDKRWEGTQYNKYGNVTTTYSKGVWKPVKVKPSSSYASSSSSSPKVWCVNGRGWTLGVTPSTVDHCRHINGTAFGTRALAYAQYRRLKSASSTSTVSSDSASFASLTIRSNVRGDRVYIDGKYKGSTRLDLDLSKGYYTVRIEKDGYKPYEEEIDLKNALTLRASLEKIAEKPVRTASTDNTSVEVTFWKTIQGSDDPDMYREYLRQFPEGVYAGLSRLKIKKLGGTSVAKASIPNLAYGDYYALVIGNNRYDHLSHLRTAVNDVRSVANLLESDYGFNVTKLGNANREQIVNSISGLRSKVTTEDNVLIYYAGHGVLDEDADEGYWLPVDASRNNPANWVMTDQVVSQVRAMKAKHVMVVADSCFSGTITRGLKIEQRTPGWLQKIVKKKSRTALTSGGLEPVMDSGGGNHSAFAKAFISLLEENEGVLDASQLFSQLRPKVMVNSTQTPEYGNIHLAGHDGGDFLFVRQ